MEPPFVNMSTVMYNMMLLCNDTNCGIKSVPHLKYSTIILIKAVIYDTLPSQ